MDFISKPTDAGAAGLRLADLAPGSTARVLRVDLEDPVGRRLLDLGFVPDTRVRVLRRAPLGDPVTYELRGTRLCLRRSEACRVWVELDARTESPPGARGGPS